MATPVERIYEAATAALSGQQQQIAQITGSVAPVGTAAAAVALLMKPALVKVTQAGFEQVAGLVVGGAGLVVVLVGAVVILRGVDVESVDPTKLLETTARDPTILLEDDRFHMEAAKTLATTKTHNDEAIQGLRAIYILMAAGLVAELIGLAAAAAVHL
jgi:hypothetical protein